MVRPVACAGGGRGPATGARGGGCRTSHGVGVGRVLSVLQDAFGLMLVGRGQCVQGGVGQVTGAAESLIGVLGHALGDDLVQRRRHPSGPQLAGPRRGLHQMRSDQSFECCRPGTAASR